MKMVKCVDTHLSILIIWSTISHVDMSVKKTWLVIYDPILLSTFFTCLAYMQNFKKYCKYLMTPPELFMPCHVIKLKICATVPDLLWPLCPVSDLFLQSEPVCCTWSMWFPCFHVITKILHLPFTLLLLVSPFAIYNHSTLCSKWMNEWSERM